jgi:hypothetical protein
LRYPASDQCPAVAERYPETVRHSHAHEALLASRGPDPIGARAADEILRYTDTVRKVITNVPIEQQHCRRC